MHLLVKFILIGKFFLCLITGSAVAQESLSSIKHILVIGVDGMSPDGIRQAKTPNIDWLVANGASTFRARGVLPSSSSPNWASMIMGAGPVQHGITSNAWEKDDFVLPAAAASDNGYFPSIFTLVHDQKPKATAAAIYHWDGFGRLFDSTLLDLSISPETEDATAEMAADYLTKKQPLFCFVHFDHVDGAGHSKGHGTPDYYTAVSKADSLIGVLLGALRQAKMLEHTLVILSADHGGIGFGHGGETPEEVEIPFILYGKTIKPGYQIKGMVNTCDNAVTAAFALGLEIPNAWTGRPVKEAFIGYDVPKITYPVKPLIRKPRIHPEKIGFEQAGGLFIDSLPILKIDNPNESGTIHYTLNGDTPEQSDPVYNQPFSLKKTTVVKAAIFDDHTKISKDAVAYFRILDPAPDRGVQYETYLVPGIDKLPEFTQLKPASKGQTHEIHLADVKLPQDEQVAAIFTSYINIKTAGEYRFYLASDDGSKLYINDELVVDNDGDHGVIERSGKINLPVGKQRLKVQWFNGGGGSGLYLFYKGPDVPKQLVPADVLYVK